MIKYHPDGTSPRNGEVFVFGSNQAGIHGAGAAKAAVEHYGAKMSVGSGRVGNSYAIPTKDRYIKTLPLSAIKPYVDMFIDYAKNNSDVQFWMTSIGCGLAGYTPKDIAPLFNPPLPNVNYPYTWKQYLDVRQRQTE